jgi:hypothetical protein
MIAQKKELIKVKKAKLTEHMQNNSLPVIPEAEQSQI